MEGGNYMWYLKLRMYILVAVLFAIVYAMVSIISYKLGVTNFYFYLALSFVLMFIQYMVGPKLVEWSMSVTYIKEGEYPELRQMVEKLAMKANIPAPRIGIAHITIPNAFAFGRSIKDGRICVTQGIMSLLNKDELQAVLGHEMTHLKNRDVLTITLLSVIPMILYRIAWQFLFFGGRRDKSQGSAALVGLVAFIFYFVTNLLVLYASRIREHFADKGSVDLGNNPSSLATALYKLVYGSARIPKDELKTAEGMKAFFVNDPSRALTELRDLRELDLDRSGTISSNELDALQRRAVKLNFGDKVMEIFSTHPNMLKRIKRLSEWQHA
ncbi:MAG: peptidase [Omnitrophica bacterium RIFCSPHIGHO2_02_FULL_46_20]|nr:MAG: peptidase [Omnitrophica bacterium RIFCSPHIGHO2_02_FULL_46_20]